MSKKKYIVGLGCSWTQGEGGYPEHIWTEYNGHVQIRGGPDYHLRAYEHENSWVNQLCVNHFKDYTPMNLGVRGIGNTAAVNQLHFCDKIDWANSEGYIVLMLSGFERLDFVQRHPKYMTPNQPDGYSNGEYTHYKWRSAWPVPGEGGQEEPLWDIYSKMLWSEQFAATNAVLAILNAQTFAKAHGFKLIIANAFNQPLGGVQKYLIQNTGGLALKIDWKTYLHRNTEYTAFAQLLVEKDGLMNPKDWGGHYEFYNKRAWPAKYLTNCIHPTVEGYKTMAEELAKYITTHHA